MVGDSRTLKVHVHTDDPERATAVFADAGEVSHLDVGDMHAQAAGRSQRLMRSESGAADTMSEQGDAASAPAGHGDIRQGRCGAVAVVNGAGFAQLFAELGVHTIDGGPTLNPSTYEVLAAIHEVDAEEVVVLPCSPNVMMAAERAAELSEQVRSLVVKVTSQQAALAAAVALMPEQGVERNAQALTEALAGMRTGAVAEAARDDRSGRFGPGDAVGFVDEEVVAWGDPGETLRNVLARLADGAELISVLAGRNTPLDPAAVEGAIDGHARGCRARAAKRWAGRILVAAGRRVAQP